jgi:ADP-ribose pyrophosphatase
MSHFKIVKTLEKKEYGNKFSVEKLLVELPDGRQTEFYMRSGQDYAIIVPVIGESTLIMVEQPRLGMEGISLEFPMGQVDGKKDDDIAITELREETGYKAGKLDLLGKLLPSPGWSMQNALVYVATDLIEGSPEPEPFEEITVRKVEVSELKQLIRDGKMISMPTIAAFYMYLQRAEKLR